MVAERISQPNEAPDEMVEPTPIRSSEGKLLLEKIDGLQKTIKTVVDGVSELQTGQGRILGEVSNNAARTQLMGEELGLLRKAISSIPTMQQKIDSMRPKMDSVPVLVEDKVEEILTHRELTGFREQAADKKMLRLEAYKVVLAVVLAGVLGVAANIGYNALLYAAAHAKPAATAR